MNQLRSLAGAVMAMYRDIDTAVAVFQQESGLACPTFCGRCCDSQKVEATVIECLPMALALTEAGEGVAAFNTIEELSDNQRCLLYDPLHESRRTWGCGRYETRPLICRMFGFAGNPDRLGQPRLALCKVMKGDSYHDGDEYRLAAAHMPIFHEAALRIAALHPGADARPLPINHALRLALRNVESLRYLEALQKASTDQPTEPPNSASGQPA